MELFLKRTRGSITVMVSLILIPTIFFTGFMVDLSRIKLYGNQAVMTADNYGEAVLTNYDNLLKELYGLFAVSQNEEGKQALDDLNAYIKASFAPNTSTISHKYLNAIRGTTEYDGFMPYQAADVTLSYEAVEGANLDNTAVLSTQIGDFMKFRIAQTMMDGGDTILNAVEEIQKMENNAEAIDKKCELDEKAGEVVEAAQAYYNILKEIEQYPSYLTAMNRAYENAKTTFNNAVNSGSYQTYKNYMINEDAIKAAVKRQNNLKKGETLTAQELEYIAMNNAYQADGNARTSYFAGVFEDAIGVFADSTDSEPIDFDNYIWTVWELGKAADKVKRLFGELNTLRSQLQSVLNDPNVSDSLKTGMTEELNRLDALFEVNGKFSADHYVNLANAIESHVDQNEEHKGRANNISLRMEEIERAYLYFQSVPGWYDKLDVNNWYKWKDNATYNDLYNSLKEWFDDADGSAAKKAKKKKAEANDKLKSAEGQLTKDETTKARDIPTGFGMGKKGTAGEFALTRMIKTAASYFKSNSFAHAGNKMLLQLYTVQYDFGMFSSRITNVKETDDGEKETSVSLTGYEMSQNINYLYQAELEYLFGGFNSSVQNLNDARNKILAFRAIVNFTATYSVSEVNDPIKVIAEAASVVNPALGLVVSGALRLAVAGLETVKDWEELKKGEGVVLIKNELQDLTAYDDFKNLIGADATKSGESTGLKLDYEQYLLVMLLFMTTPEQISERTGNLICLNVNTVQQNIGSGKLSELKFKLTDAITAVNATCSVHLDFVVMPKGFASAMVDDSTYAQLESYEKNTYKFTVTRGY